MAQDAAAALRALQESQGIAVAEPEETRVSPSTALRAFQKGALARAQQFAVELGQGALGTLEAVPQAQRAIREVAVAAGVPENLARAMSPTVEALEGVLALPKAGLEKASDPVLAAQGGFMQQDVPRGIGSGVSFLAGGGALRAAGMGAKGAAALAGSLVGFSSGYYDARGEGASEAKSLASGLIGAGLGTTEAAGLGRVLGRIGTRLPKGQVARTILRNLSEVPEEAVQEGIQGTVTNLVAAHVLKYDEDRELFEGVARSMGAGAMAAAVLGGVATAAQAGTSGVPIGTAGVPEADPGGKSTPSTPTEGVEGGVQQDPRGSTGAVLAEERPELRPTRPQAPQAEVEAFRGLVAANERAETEARVVEPTTETDLWAEDFLAQRGARLVLVDAGSSLPLPARYAEGVVALDARSSPQAQARALVFHEMAHHLRVNREVSWEELYRAIEAVDPSGLRHAEAEYEAAFARARGRTLDADARREEGLSAYIEAISGYLEVAYDDPRVLLRLKKPTLLRQVLDAVVEVLRRFGAPIDTPTMRELAKLRERVGDQVSGSAATELRASIALRVKAALDEALATPVPDLGPQVDVSTEKSGQRAVEFPQETGGEGEVRPPLERPPIPEGLTPKQRKRAQKKARRDAVKAEEKRRAAERKKARERGKARREKRLERAREDVREAGAEPMFATEYRDLQRRAKQAGIPANQAAQELRERIAAHEGGRDIAEERPTGWFGTRREADSHFAFMGYRVVGEAAPFRLERRAPGGWEPMAGEFSTPRAAYDAATADINAAPDSAPRFAVAPPTDSPEFRRWFGDSKVVDERGEPLVVYHGTTGAFTAFDTTLRGSVTKADSAASGFFFTDRADVATEYAEVFGGREERALQRRMEELERIAQRTGQQADWDAHQSVLEQYERVALGSDPRLTSGANVIPAYLRLERLREYDFEGRQWEEGRLVSEIREARGAGGDGVVFRNVHDDPVASRIGDVYVVFDPNSIKSATGNVGTFDPQNPDIRFAAAYHGSGAEFDRFDTGMIGTGEGAQAFGWGLYFAGRKEIAKHYKDKLAALVLELPSGGSVRAFTQGDFIAAHHRLRDELEGLGYESNDADSLVDDILQEFADHDTLPAVGRSLRALANTEEERLVRTYLPREQAREVAERYARAAQALDRLVEAGLKLSRGAGYEVELAPAEDEYLLWDEPLSAQSEKVRAALQGAFERVARGDAGWASQMVQYHATQNDRGEAIYRELADQHNKKSDRQGLRGDQGASLALRESGIRGIKYRDAGARGKGGDSYNYVIFDDADVSITGRFAARKGPSASEAREVESLQRQAAREGEATEIGTQGGFRKRLADTSDDDDLRALGRAAREMNPGLEAESLEEWVEGAEEALREDYAGERKRLLAKVSRGDVLTATETVALDKIRRDSSLAALRSGGDTQAYQDATRVNWAYQQARAQAARSLRAIGDAMNEQASPRSRMMEMVLTPTQRTRRRLKRLSKEIDRLGVQDATKRTELEAKVRAELERDAKKSLRAMKRLEKAGLHPELAVQDYITDRATYARMSRMAWSEKAGTWDPLLEFRLTAMLSGPSTHAANVTGNAYMASLELVGKRAAEAAVNLVVQDPASPTFGEVREVLSGVMTSLGQAGANFLEAYKTEMPAYELSLREKGADVQELAQKLDSLRHPVIGGAKGRVLRAPSLTTLLAFDEFFKTVVGQSHARGLAYRLAKNEGLEGDALTERMDEILGDGTHDVWNDALQAARRATFQDVEDSKLLRTVQGIRDWMEVPMGPNLDPFPAGKVVLPFTNTPVRILQHGMVGAFAPLKLLAKASLGSYRADGVTQKADLVQDAGLAMLSLGVWLALYAAWDSQDEDRPLITGTKQWNPDDPVPGQAIRVGDTYYSYARIDPLAVSVASILDVLENHDNPVEAARSVFRQMSDKTFLRSLSDAYEALTAERGGKAKFARFVRSTALSFVPNIIKAPLRETQDASRITTLRETADAGIWERALESLPYQAFPFEGEHAPPIRYDWLGEPVQRPNSRVPYLWRLVTPIRDTGELRQRPAELVLLKWNRMVEEGRAPEGSSRVTLRPPPRSYRLDRPLTDEEYSELLRRSGIATAELLEGYEFDTDNVTDEQVEFIRKSIARARKRARAELGI